jgi:hypothetical protein
MKSRLRAALVLLQGLSCTHRRMREVACPYCKERGLRLCRYECPDCKVSWMLEEGERG